MLIRHPGFPMAGCLPALPLAGLLLAAASTVDSCSWLEVSTDMQVGVAFHMEDTDSALALDAGTVAPSQQWQ